MEIGMEVWVVELAAVVLVLACIVQGACQGLLLKLYSLVRAVLFLAGFGIVTYALLIVLPAGLTGRQAVAVILGMILVGAVLGIVAHLLKIVDHIPVINTFNKLGGAVFGAVLGILLLWVLMFLFVLGKDIAWCREVDEAVRQSRLLFELYRINPLWVIVLKF